MQRPAVQFQSPPSGETQLAPGVGTAVAVVDVRVQVLVVAHLGAKLLAAVYYRAHEVTLRMNFQVVLQVGLAEEDPVTVLVRAAELLGVFVGLRMLRQPVLRGECLLTSLYGALERFLSRVCPHMNVELGL